MFTRFVFPVLVLTVIFVIGYWVQLLVKKFRVSQHLMKHLQFLEQRYLEFVHDRKMLADIQSEPTESLVEAVVLESAPMLKPEVDALLDQLEQANQRYLPKSLNSDIFPNVLAAYRQLWEGQDVSKLLTEEERNSFRESIGEAVRADVSRRILIFKTDSRV